MKQVIQLIGLGLKHGRFFIEARNLKLKKILLVSLIPILAMALNLGRDLAFYQFGIQDQVRQLETHIPDFTFSETGLLTSELDKPIYYQSDDLQFVLDPSLKANPIFHRIPISKDKMARIDKTKLFQIYLLQDQAHIVINDRHLAFEDGRTVLPNQDVLKSILQFISQPPAWYYLILFIILFLAATIQYSLIVVLTTALVAVFNHYLNQPLNFINRLKIIIPLSLIPILGIELLKLLLGNFNISLFLFASFILFLYYISFKDYTQFVTSFITVSKLAMREQEKMENELKRLQPDFRKLKEKQDHLKNTYQDLVNKLNKLKNDQDKDPIERKIRQIEAEIIKLEIQIQDKINQYKAKKNKKKQNNK